MQVSFATALWVTLSWMGCLGLAAPSFAEEASRNPFGLKDVADPDGADVQQFAEARLKKLTGGPDDPNAAQWVEKATSGDRDALSGQWFERWGQVDAWSPSRAPAEVKVVGQRVYILAHCSNGRFLLDLKRDGQTLVGRYQGIDNPQEILPCVFRIVDHERLDGYWPGGRWDFRRKLAPRER